MVTELASWMLPRAVAVIHKASRAEPQMKYDLQQRTTKPVASEFMWQMSFVPSAPKEGKDA
jgi:hypothetical protein